MTAGQAWDAYVTAQRAAGEAVTQCEASPGDGTPEGDRVAWLLDAADLAWSPVRSRGHGKAAGRAMTVYVDHRRQHARIGRPTARWPHPTAGPDHDLAERHAFAAATGLNRSRSPGPPADRHPHDDATGSTRRQAVRAGTVATTCRDAARHMIEHHPGAVVTPAKAGPRPDGQLTLPGPEASR